MVLTKEIPLPPVCLREVLRYAGCRRETEELTALLQSCIREAEPVLVRRVCWRADELMEAADMTETEYILGLFQQSWAAPLRERDDFRKLLEHYGNIR